MTWGLGFTSGCPCCASAGQKARDLRNWLTVYGYWNQGGRDNVATMLLYLVDQYLAPTGIPPKPVQETPPTGKRAPPQSAARCRNITSMLCFSNRA